MDKTLKLINERTLYLYDNDNNIIAGYNPRWTKFVEVKRIKQDCNIIKEDDEYFRSTGNYNLKGNIYCLDDSFKVRWIIDTSFENDSFTGSIGWNKQTSLKQGEDIIDNPSTFICYCWSGMIVTIDYESGQAINRVLYK